jgi:23S rRNA G2445 N2-methylase RlmL
MTLESPSTLLVTCPRGLVDVLRSEVEALGYSPLETHETGLTLRGTLHDAMRLNLWLRTAYNVLYQLKTFDCRTPRRLYNRVQTIDWTQLLTPDDYLTVVSKIDTPSVNNSMFANVRVKDAICDQLADRTGRRPDSGSDRSGVVVHLFWKANRAWLYLNTSGSKLADRSYRKLPHNAPMQETLAAGVMLLTGHDGSQPLVTPMCGSGTLAIEAALIATGRAPGLLRTKYGFTHLKVHDEQAWQTLRHEANKLGRKRKDIAPIVASDIDPQAIRAARANAMTAGVQHLIEFHVCDFAATPMPDEPGLVVMNPEYGKRLGDTDELKTTYGRIGDFLKQRCAGWTGYVFTGNLELAKCIGLRAARRMPLFNAEIECRLLKYDLYAGSRDRAAQSS